MCLNIINITEPISCMLIIYNILNKNIYICTFDHCLGPVCGVSAREHDILMIHNLQYK